jgi:hypothetical protein
VFGRNDVIRKYPESKRTTNKSKGITYSKIREEVKDVRDVRDVKERDERKEQVRKTRRTKDN